MTNITYFGRFDSDPEALKAREIANSNSLLDFDGWVLSQLPLTDKCSVLDLGCGSGRHLLKIREQFPNSFLRGVDLNPSDSLQIDICCFDEYVPDRKYDIIFSSYALYYSKNLFERLLFLKNFASFIFLCGPAAGTNKELDFLSPIHDFLDEDSLAKLAGEFFWLETVRFDNKIVFKDLNGFNSWWENHNSYDEKFSPNLEFPFSLSKNVLGVKLYV